MDGVGGYHSWRWIFILEGICTVIIGIAAFFFVADFPDEARWLTEAEKSWVMARTGRGKELDQKVAAKDILVFFSDIKNILGGIIYFGKRSKVFNASLLHADHTRCSYCGAHL